MDGIRLLFRRARLHLNVLYLCPEETGLRYVFKGCVISCSIMFAICIMALLFKSVRLGVERPIISEAVVVMHMSLVLFLTVSML